jgi:hypothetical protein
VDRVQSRRNKSPSAKIKRIASKLKGITPGKSFRASNFIIIFAWKLS